MKEYYDRRASEYEAIYRRDDPVRQGEQSKLGNVIRKTLAGRRVLEVACGTGFWTQVAAEVAQHVVAIDTSPKMLTIAKRKDIPSDRVLFQVSDAYQLGCVEGDFDAGLAMFWLSHIPRTRLSQFLDGFHWRIGRGAPVVLADNVHVPGLGGELITRSGVADTFKIRTLADGSSYEVVKNYFNAEEIRGILGDRTVELDVRFGECFWWAEYATC